MTSGLIKQNLVNFSNKIWQICQKSWTNFTKLNLTNLSNTLGKFIELSLPNLSNNVWQKFIKKTWTTSSNKV